MIIHNVIYMKSVNVFLEKRKKFKAKYYASTYLSGIHTIFKHLRYNILSMIHYDFGFQHAQNYQFDGGV
jgi:hypothetical protein